MGDLLGHAVRFGNAGVVLESLGGEIAEEFHAAAPFDQRLPLGREAFEFDALDLAAILFPPSLRRLYVLRDRDPAGEGARDSLVARAASLGIEAVSLTPFNGDFNDDLRRRGADALRAALMDQLHPEDVRRFMEG